MSELITPGNLSHLHLLINHFPTVGLTVAFALLVISIISDSEAMKHDTMRPTAFDEGPQLTAADEGNARRVFRILRDEARVDIFFFKLLKRLRAK